MDLNRSGIYKIENLTNNKIYIGSAVNIKKRWDRHKYNLNHQKHNNKYLQASWNKHGESNFEFKVLQLIEYKKNLIDCEQFWIDKTYCAYRKHGYNVCQKAGNTLGFKMSSEQKKTQSNRLEVYYKTEAGKKTKEKMSKSSIGRTITEKTRKKLSDNARGEKNSFYGKKHTKESIRKGQLNQPHRNFVVQINKNNMIIVNMWVSINEIYRMLGYSLKSISLCCKYYNSQIINKKSKYSYEYAWIKLPDLSNNPKLIRQLFFKEVGTID